MLSKLRQLARDSLRKQMIHNAIMLVELIFRTPDFDASDIVLSAQCFFQNAEYRRSLAMLESKGLLSIENIQTVCEMINASDHSIQEEKDNQDKQSDTLLLSSASSSSSSSSKMHIVSAIQLASTCLLKLEQYDDCLALVEPLLTKGESMDALELKQLQKYSSSSEVNIFAGIFTNAGRCFDMLENRPRAIKAFNIALEIDVACIEALDYMVQNSLLTRADADSLLEKELNFSGDKEFFSAYHRYLLNHSEDNDLVLRTILCEKGDNYTNPNLNGSSFYPIDNVSNSTAWLIQSAECSYDNYLPEEAYRLSRQAYSMDPFDNRGLLVYIASMIDLNLKTELFYLGHELSHAYPKLAVSWYAIGCYYWCCKKLELAQKFLQKCTKIDKRFSKGWILLGVVLSAQEESEHAISAFRAATRLLPGNYRPLAFMSKELVRTYNLSLAQHLLNCALELNPCDPTLLNEFGIILLKTNKLAEALDRFKEAITYIENPSSSNKSIYSKRYPMIYSQRQSGCEEIYNNYATCLRKCALFDEALIWYEKCLGMDQNNANTHANIAFTYHVSGAFEKAVASYHRALSLEPTMTICADMMVSNFTFFFLSNFFIICATSNSFFDMCILVMLTNREEP